MQDFYSEIKAMIIEVLALEEMTVADIQTDAPLFGEGLGLDSIDALELGVALKQRYNLQIKGDDEQAVKVHFYSVATLADYIRSQTESK